MTNTLAKLLSDWRDNSKSLAEIKKRAQAGDTSVMPLLRDVLRESPHLWQSMGNIAMATTAAVIDRALNNNLLGSESLKIYIADRADKIAGSNPDALERLLADRIAVCQFNVDLIENSCKLDPDITIAKLNHNEQRLERAQRMLTSAIKTLAQVRRLGMPAMQINIGDKQINTIG